MPWEARLSAFLEGADRVVVLGIGNPSRADDGAGTRVAEIIRRLVTRRRFRVPCLGVPGGAAPENFTGATRRFGPARTVLVDAVSAGLPAGAVTMLDPHALGGITLSSHTMPLGILGDYLRQEGFGEQVVVGIQPATIELGRGMSKPVRDSSLQVARTILRCLW